MYFFCILRTHLSEIFSQSRRGGPKGWYPGVPPPPCSGGPSTPVFVRSATLSSCEELCIICPAVPCCVRLGLWLLCVPLLYRPVFATLARCAHLIRLPLSYISAPPPALAHAWCMLVPAFYSSLPVSVWVHHSGSSGVERAEFTPYPSETIEKNYPIRMVKGVYLSV